MRYNSRLLLAFEGLDEVGGNLLLTAHDAVKVNGLAIGGDTESFLNHGRIVRGDEHFRTLFHDVGQQQEDGMTTVSLDLLNLSLQSSL